MNYDSDNHVDTLREETPSILQPNSEPQQQPRKSKQKAVLLAVGAVILFLLASGTAYFLTKEYSDDEQSSSTTPTTAEEDTTESTLTAERLVNGLKPKITGEQQRIDLVTESGGTGPSDGLVYAAAAYQSGEQKFAVYPAKHHGFGTWSTADIALSDIVVIESYLKEHDIVEASEGSGIFASKSIVCAVRLLTVNINGFDGVSLGCSDMDDYDIKYQAALPFYRAYSATVTDITENLLFSSPVIKDGAEGYKNAYVSIGSNSAESTGGFAGLFYLSPNTEEWTFLVGTQNDLNCDLFDTDILKKAFYNQRCINLATGEETVVKF